MSAADFVALDDWNEPLPLEERERLLDAVARAVARRGLQTPALFALEIHRPLTFVASQGIVALTPMLGPLLGLERMQKVGRLLAEPGVVDALIERIEGEAPPAPNNGGAKPGEGRGDTPSGSPIIGGGGGLS